MPDYSVGGGGSSATYRGTLERFQSSYSGIEEPEPLTTTSATGVEATKRLKAL